MYVSKDIDEEGVYTDPITLHHGDANLSITGTFVGTVTVDRSFDGGFTWGTVNSYTEPVEETIFECEDNVKYRAGFATGAYTSGSALCRIGQR